MRLGCFLIILFIVFPFFYYSQEVKTIVYDFNNNTQKWSEENTNNRASKIKNGFIQLLKKKTLAINYFQLMWVLM
jgi:hypothetical protein